MPRIRYHGCLRGCESSSLPRPVGSGLWHPRTQWIVLSQLLLRRRRAGQFCSSIIQRRRRQSISFISHGERAPVGRLQSRKTSSRTCSSHLSRSRRLHNLPKTIWAEATSGPRWCLNGSLLVTFLRRHVFRDRYSMIFSQPNDLPVRPTSISVTALVMLRFVENIDISFRYRYIEQYRIGRLSTDFLRYVVTSNFFDFIFLDGNAVASKKNNLFTTGVNSINQLSTGI